jgi:branched-chain amino acid transport system permease protein
MKPITEGSAGIRLRKLVYPDALFTYDVWLYYSILIGLVIVILVGLSITRSRIGYTLLSIKTNELAATYLGVNITFYKVFAFFISAAIAGFAGGFSAVVIGYISPESFDLIFALALLTGSVVGGVVSVFGAIFGGFFVVFVPVISTDISEALTGVTYGVILMIIIYGMPDGIVGRMTRILDKSRK